jgi:hypothetical protein
MRTGLFSYLFFIFQEMFQPFVNEFFVSATEPSFTRSLKLEILTYIATPTNIHKILKVRERERQGGGRERQGGGRLRDAERGRVRDRERQRKKDWRHIETERRKRKMAREESERDQKQNQARDQVELERERERD